MKLNWRMWQSLANREAVDKAATEAKPKPIPKSVRKAARPKLIDPHRDGPHSSN